MRTNVQLEVRGRLIDWAEERTDTNGKPYTVAHVEAERGDGVMRLFVLSFSGKVSLKLQALEPGSMVAVGGPLEIRRNGEQTSLGLAARRVKLIH